jgi:hypothetical protein
MSQNFSFGFKSLYLSGIKGYGIQRDILNDWQRQYFVLDAPFLKIYFDETCGLLCNSLRIEKNSLVHSCVDFDNHSNVIKLEMFSIGDNFVHYLSLDDFEQQNSLCEAISEIIHGGFRLVSLKYLWSTDFYPIMSIQCKFLNNLVEDGSLIPSTSVLSRPTVTVTSSTDESVHQQYSLLLLNADFTEESGVVGGTDRLYLDWAVTNISGGNVSTGVEVCYRFFFFIVRFVINTTLTTSGCEL